MRLVHSVVTSTLFNLPVITDETFSNEGSSDSDVGPSDDDDDESERHSKTQYVHPKGKDKGGDCKHF